MLIVLAVAAPNGFSADTKTFPGAGCHAAYASDAASLYRGGGTIANMSTSKNVWIECPIVKDADHMLGAVATASAWVVDGDPGTLSKDVQCFVSIHFANNANVWTDSISRSASTGGLASQPKQLDFNFNMGGLYPMRHYYLLRCSLPPLYNGNRSTLIMYRVTEK